ncbi:MAG: hypothetical protein GF331_05365 [Chitinivibrionales bacterium]|nr:hypothetical protein [Chitinivibrionales bacterium]
MAAYYVSNSGADVKACDMTPSAGGDYEGSGDFEGVWTPADGVYKVYLEACDDEDPPACTRTAVDDERVVTV